MIILKLCKNCNKVANHLTTKLIKNGHVFIRNTCEACGYKTDNSDSYIHYGEDSKHSNK